jgi:hypothetical protein
MTGLAEQGIDDVSIRAVRCGSTNDASAAAEDTTAVQSAEATEPGPSFHHLKFFESREGSWDSHGTLAGRDFTGKVTYQWLLNRNVLVANWMLQFGPDDVDTSVEVIGYDPRDRQVESWTFSANGSRWHNVFSLGNDMAAVRIEGVTANGDPVAATGVSRELSDDSWEVHAVIPAGPGGERGDYVAYFKRGEPADCHITAENCTVAELRDLQAFAGKWNYTARNEAGETEAFQGEAHWVLDGQFQAWGAHKKSDDGDAPDFFEVRGFDPVTGNIRSWGFGDDGSLVTGVWTKIGEDWLLSWETVAADGEVQDAECNVKVAPGRLELKIVDGPVPQTIISERVD